MPDSANERLEDSSVAVLVGVQLPGVSDTEHASDLAELGRLTRTLGFEIADTITQRRDMLAAGAVLGEGKLRELAELTGGKGVVAPAARLKPTKARARFRIDGNAPRDSDRNGRGKDGNGYEHGDAGDVDFDDLDTATAGDGASAGKGTGKARKPNIVIVDHDITPSQARNLERATGARVLDRTGVIVEIFHRHARSREARLQVEIARLTYVAPRLRESANSERQRGRGAGESMLELDRRKIRDRIAELRQELAAIQKQQANRRQARRDQPRVALVGYTNAGKSSLMRALTGCDVLVEDKLFATLDTTVRALQPEQKPRILISDTVGFIKKLPHDLVASFRSTLDEALEASLLVQVVDASDPTHDSQMEVTQTVLSDIGADMSASRLVFNKADQLSTAEREALRQAHPDALVLSAHDTRDISALRRLIVEFFEAQMVCADLTIPYMRQALVAEVHENASVLSEHYDDTGTHLQVRGWPAVVARFQAALQP